MPFVSFSRCRLGEESHDLPIPTREEIFEKILPKLDAYDCCILSFTHLQVLYIENRDALGVVAWGHFAEERQHVKLSCRVQQNFCVLHTRSWVSRWFFFQDASHFDIAQDFVWQRPCKVWERLRWRFAPGFAAKRRYHLQWEVQVWFWAVAFPTWWWADVHWPCPIVLTARWVPWSLIHFIFVSIGVTVAVW